MPTDQVGMVFTAKRLYLHICMTSIAPKTFFCQGAIHGRTAEARTITLLL